MLPNLPTELIRYIFQFMSDEDLYMCSGTCKSWYEMSNLELKLRNSLKIYRWPFQPPDGGCSKLAVMGCRSIKELSFSKVKLQHLLIGTDEPCPLLPGLLESVLKPHTTHLRYLELVNFEIDFPQIEIILSNYCRSNIFLRIKVQNIEDLSSESIKILSSIRDFLKGFTIECNETNTSITYFSETLENSTTQIPKFKNISLNGPSIANIKVNLTSVLNSLTLKNMKCLNLSSLVEISKIPNLRHFHIEKLNKNIKSIDLSRIFFIGFDKLYSLCIKNCMQLCRAVISVITNKYIHNLQHLDLDMRFSEMPKSCIEYLKYLKKLKSLRLLLPIEFEETMGYYELEESLKSHWPNLENINFKYGSRW